MRGQKSGNNAVNLALFLTSFVVFLLLNSSRIIIVALRIGGHEGLHTEMKKAASYCSSTMTTKVHLVRRTLILINFPSFSRFFS